MRCDWWRRSALTVLTTVGVLACSGVNGDAGNIRDPNDPGIEPPEGSGFIEVTVATTNPVANTSYTVTISNGQKQTAGANATLTFTTKRTGTHEISLSSVPAGCVVAGDNPIVVDVRRSEHVDVAFSVTCQGIPG